MPPDLESRVRALLLELGLRDAEDVLSKLLPGDPAQRVVALQPLEALSAQTMVWTRLGHGSTFPS